MRLAFSRHDLPEVLQVNLAPKKSEGAGKTGCTPHPRSRVQWVDSGRTRAYRFGGDHTGLPCATALRLIRVRPGDRLSCHRHPWEALLPLRLDASTGASGPHDFTVRLASSVRTLLRATPSRPSRPPPTFATTADAPLAGKDGGSFKVFLPGSGSGIFFARGLDGWNRVDRVEEISLWAQGADRADAMRPCSSSPHLTSPNCRADTDHGRKDPCEVTLFANPDDIAICDNGSSWTAINCLAALTRWEEATYAVEDRWRFQMRERNGWPTGQTLRRFGPMTVSHQLSSRSFRKRASSATAQGCPGSLPCPRAGCHRPERRGR